jgi:hypothetical protein
LVADKILMILVIMIAIMDSVDDDTEVGNAKNEAGDATDYDYVKY